MKLTTVVGARPQFIKAAAISRVVRKTAGITEKIIHTGQHFDEDMSKVFFDEMSIPEADYNLGVSGGTHGCMTGQQLEKIEAVLMDETPDVLLVYGDTNSTLAGALAAAKLHIPLIHVEAGLRSFNRKMPEEINRIVTDHVADILFCPSQTAVKNLEHEGIAPEKIVFSGDVMYDTALFYSGLSDERSTIVSDLGLTHKEFRLCTVHRQENTDDSTCLKAIFEGLQHAAQQMPLVIPMHPRTRKMLSALEGGADLTKGLTIIDPVGFLDIIALLKGAHSVLTDSGGMQKEAYFHGTPVVILRDETEWIELIDIGAARLTPPVDAQKLIEAIEGADQLHPRPDQYPYGRGDAAQRIVTTLEKL